MFELKFEIGILTLKLEMRTNYISEGERAQIDQFLKFANDICDVGLRAEIKAMKDEPEEMEG